MTRKPVLFIFAIAYAVLLGSAFAQPAVTAQEPDQLQSVAGAARDDQQDATARREGQARDVELDRIEAEVRRNREALALRQAGYTFWRDVLNTLMPILSSVGIALVAWLQIRAARERKLMAQSINGMKTELVAQTRAAAFHEGALLEREKDNPNAPPVVQRGQQLADDARKAGEIAQILAAQAAGEKPSPLVGQPPAKPPEGLAADTVVLKAGDEVTVAAEPPKPA